MEYISEESFPGNQVYKTKITRKYPIEDLLIDASNNVGIDAEFFSEACLLDPEIEACLTFQQFFGNFPASNFFGSIDVFIPTAWSPQSPYSANRFARPFYPVLSETSSKQNVLEGLWAIYDRWGNLEYANYKIAPDKDGYGLTGFEMRFWGQFYPSGVYVFVHNFGNCDNPPARDDNGNHFGVSQADGLWFLPITEESENGRFESQRYGPRAYTGDITLVR